MNIKPVSGSGTVQPTAPSPQAAQSAKARAMAILTQSPSAQPEAQIVQNQNSIQPEELGAIKAKSEEEQEVVGQTGDVVEEKAETPKAEDPALSRQFAQLARQEKALRMKAQQQEQQFKAREEAIRAKEAQFSQEPKADYSGYISKDRFKTDPLAVLAETGLSYDDLVQQMINPPTRDPRTEATISKLEAKIQALEARNEESAKSVQEQQNAAYQAAVKQIESDARALVASDPTFEMIKATRSTKDVVKLIEETYHKDGVLLTVEEAAQQVEDYLSEEAMKLTQIEKIKRKIQTSAPNVSSATAQKMAEKAVKQPQPMKTLTNATSSTRQLSAKERAVLAFKGELKS